MILSFKNRYVSYSNKKTGFKDFFYNFLLSKIIFNYGVSIDNNIALENLVSNPNISIDFLIQHFNCSFVFSRNLNYKIKYIGKDYKNNQGLDCFNSRLDWFAISSNENTTLKCIEDNLHLPWDWTGVSVNPNITIDFVKKHKDKKFSSYLLASNPNISIKDIENESDLCLLKGITLNPNLTIDKLLQYKRHNIDWYLISSHPSIKMTDIENNLDLSWNWKGVSRNPNLTIEMIKIHFLENWDWKAISCNPNITIKDIEENPRFFWTPAVLSNPNHTKETLEKYWNKFLSPRDLCENNFLFNNTVFKKSIKKDIKNRRNKLKLYGDLNYIINFYIGYN